MKYIKREEDEGILAKDNANPSFQKHNLAKSQGAMIVNGRVFFFSRKSNKNQNEGNEHNAEHGLMGFSI